jgi:transposase
LAERKPFFELFWGNIDSQRMPFEQGRSPGGLTSKIHALVDGNGLPVRLALTPGEAHDNRLAEKLLSRLKFGSMLLADRGYDTDWIREFARKKGAWANIPPKSKRKDPICFSPYLCRDRNRVEQFFNRIKQCRRVATRYDKLAANYLAFVQLASGPPPQPSLPAVRQAILKLMARPPPYRCPHCRKWICTEQRRE